MNHLDYKNPVRVNNASNSFTCMAADLKWYCPCTLRNTKGQRDSQAKVHKFHSCMHNRLAHPHPQCCTFPSEHT